MASKRIKKKRAKRERHCSLCGIELDLTWDNYTVGTTRKVVCAKCLQAGQSTLHTPQPAPKSKPVTPIPPAIMIRQLDHRIIGQADAKRAVAVAMWKQQMRRNGVDFPNCGLLLFGPTGCGKTALVREAADIAGLPFLCFDATSLTETGYRGKDSADILKELVARYGKEKAQYGVRDKTSHDENARPTCPKLCVNTLNLKLSDISSATKNVDIFLSHFLIPKLQIFDPMPATFSSGIGGLCRTYRTKKF